MTVRAWLAVLAGLFAIGIGYGATQPVFDIMYALCYAEGGVAAEKADMIKYILRYIFPTLVVISLLIYGVLSSTTREDNSRYR